MRLQRLIQRANTFNDVLEEVKSFPKWYIETDEQKSLTVTSLEKLYNEVKEIESGGRYDN